MISFIVLTTIVAVVTYLISIVPDYGWAEGLLLGTTFLFAV